MYNLPRVAPKPKALQTNEKNLTLTLLDTEVLGWVGGSTVLGPGVGVVEQFMVGGEVR